MKIKSGYGWVLVVMLLSACKTETANPAEKADEKIPAGKRSPIDGNWKLVYNEIGGKPVPFAKYPPQVKLFQDGYFSFVMMDAQGGFRLAGTGPFELEGNRYKETFLLCSDTAFTGSKDWQQWELKGDTLVFYGFEKVELANGQDVTARWGKFSFVEKRVRIK